VLNTAVHSSFNDIVPTADVLYRMRYEYDHD